jgi:hypothetical protein
MDTEDVRLNAFDTKEALASGPGGIREYERQGREMEVPPQHPPSWVGDASDGHGV